MIAAKIENGKVVNRAIFKDDATLEDSWIECGEAPQIGWHYVDGNFVKMDDSND